MLRTEIPVRAAKCRQDNDFSLIPVHKERLTVLHTHNLGPPQQTVPNKNIQGTTSHWTFRSSGKSKKLRIIQRKPYQRSATFEDCLSLNQKDLIYKIEDLFSGFFSESFIKVRVRLSNYNFELLFFFLKLDVKAIKVFWFFAICMLGTARRKTCKEWKLSSDVNLCFFC